MASTVSIVLARKCAANPLALVLLSEGIILYEGAPRMTSQALLCSVLLAMLTVVYIGDKKKYVDKNMT